MSACPDSALSNETRFYPTGQLLKSLGQYFSTRAPHLKVIRRCIGEQTRPGLVKKSHLNRAKHRSRKGHA